MLSDNDKLSTAIAAAQHQIMTLQRTENALERIPVDRHGLLIEAGSDAEAIAKYLIVRCEKATTRSAVLRDLRKFALFMAIHQLPTLNSLKAEHCQTFQYWLMHPDPSLCSQMPGQADPRARPPRLTRLVNGREEPNPDWRAFTSPMTPASANKAVTSIKALYAWLVNAGYLQGNPFTLIKPLTRDTPSQRTNETGNERELPLNCIQAVVHYLDQAHPPELVSPRQLAQRRWLFYFYLYTAARLTSGCTATLDDIYIDRKGICQLTLTVKGVGVRRLDVPWIPELEEEYLRYRKALGLPAIQIEKATKRRQPNQPPSTTKGPRHLLLPLTINEHTKSSRAMRYPSVHRHLSELFKATQAWAIAHPELKLADHELAILGDASGHWIRHGTATLLGIDAKSQLGHSSQKQTDHYQAVEIKRQIHRLRNILHPEDSTYQALLDEKIEVRVEWIKKLMASVELESPEALDNIWSTYISTHPD